jgi:DNA-binding NarL/FixJ family response regulator
MPTEDNRIESGEQTTIIKGLTGIILADGHPVTLKGLEYILSDDSAFHILESCSNGDSTLSAVRRHRPELLLIDLNLPEKDGLATIAEIALNASPVRVILFAAAIDDHQTCQAIRLGVRGVLLKTMPPHLIVQCLRKVLTGGQWLERKSIHMALENTLRQQTAYEKVTQLLTKREFELTMLVAKGLCNKDAARQLNISEGSVKVYLNRIYKKLQVNNRVELTLALQKRGLI